MIASSLKPGDSQTSSGPSIMTMILSPSLPTRCSFTQWAFSSHIRGSSVTFSLQECPYGPFASSFSFATWCHLTICTDSDYFSQLACSFSRLHWPFRPVSASLSDTWRNSGKRRSRERSRERGESRRHSVLRVLLLKPKRTYKRMKRMKKVTDKRSQPNG